MYNKAVVEALFVNCLLGCFTLQNYLNQIRHRFGDPGERGRLFSLQEMVYNRVVLPEWTIPLKGVFEPDPREYHRLIFERRQLLSRGELVVGHLIQANSALFEPGHEDCPALALYSHDPFYEQDITELKRLAGMIFDMKTTEPGREELQDAAKLVRNETAVCSHYPLPEAITGGREVFMCDVMVFRKHLPGHLLSSMWAPMLVDKEHCSNIMILPAWYWPEELMEFW